MLTMESTILKCRTARSGNLLIEDERGEGCAVVSPERGGKLIWWNREVKICRIKNIVRDYVNNPNSPFNMGNYK